MKKGSAPGHLSRAASSGIGKEFTRQIAASGIHVALVGRREPLLRTVGAECTRASGVQHFLAGTIRCERNSRRNVSLDSRGCTLPARSFRRRPAHQRGCGHARELRVNGQLWLDCSGVHRCHRQGSVVRGCRRTSGLAEVIFKVRKCPNVCLFTELKSQALAPGIGECFGDATPRWRGDHSLGPCRRSFIPVRWRDAV
jgi:hypothetical protein